MINIILIILAISLCLNAFFIHNRLQVDSVARHFESPQELTNRNKAVAEFRRKILIELGENTYRKFPSYYVMMTDDEELKLETYLSGKDLEKAKETWS